jgi:excinuclease ABC subunit A
VPHCPLCGAEIAKQSPAQILEQVFTMHQNERIMILAPIARGRKGEYKKELEQIAKGGFRARVDGELITLDEPIKLDKRKNHTIEVVIDRLVVKKGLSSGWKPPFKQR